MHLVSFDFRCGLVEVWVESIVGCHESIIARRVAIRCSHPRGERALIVTFRLISSQECTFGEGMLGRRPVGIYSWEQPRQTEASAV